MSELLSLSGWEVIGVHRPKINPNNYSLTLPKYKRYEMDVRSPELLSLVLDSKPDVVIYLAGITSISESLSDPVETFEVNTISYLNLIRFMEKENLRFHLIYASSVEIFKPARKINELSELSSDNPYGISKIASTYLSRAYRSRGLRISNAILSNHESILRNSKFVTGKLAKGVADIVHGKIQKISIGDLSVNKNWSSAKDIVKGIKLLAESNLADDFIFAQDKNISLKSLVEFSFNHVGLKNWEDYIEISDDLKRQKFIESTFSNDKAKKVLGWEPRISSEIWMGEMIDFHLFKG